MSEGRKKESQIVGFRMTPSLAVKVKKEAAQRGISLRKLFEEMWKIYAEKANK